MRLFTLLTIFTIFAAAPMVHAQGFFEEDAKQSAAEEDTPAPAKEWTKQQLASIVIDATSPVLTLADTGGSEDKLKEAQELLRENKRKRQEAAENTFTRDELYAMHEFYSTLHGSNIGAKLGMGIKQDILKKLK